MRSVLIALVALALLGLNAWASVPDPDYCTVTGDGALYPKLTGVPPADGLFRADGDITIHVAAYGGTPIANCEVLIVLNEACGMCECASFDNPRYTDINGNVVMNLRWGNCCQMDAAATIYADGHPIRSYNVINSLDWDGATGDCAVILADFGEFATRYGSASVCSDISDGDGMVILPDFGLFASHYGSRCAQ
jgi:hypothetical protein